MEYECWPTCTRLIVCCPLRTCLHRGSAHNIVNSISFSTSRSSEEKEEKKLKLSHTQATNSLGKKNTAIQ